MTKKPFDTRPAGQSTDGLIELCEWLKTRIPMLDMAEVGVYEGKGSLIFARYFKHVFAIDPWRCGFDPSGDDLASVINGAEVIKRCIDNTDAAENIHIFRSTSANAATLIQGAVLDFVYIDADHSYEGVMRDIGAWLPKIKPGGAIGGHDYRPNFKGVTKAVNEHFDNVTTFQDGSWATLCL